MKTEYLNRYEKLMEKFDCVQIDPLDCIKRMAKKIEEIHRQILLLKIIQQKD